MELRKGCSFSPISYLINMDRIVKKSEFCGGVKIGDYTVQCLLFADDLVLLDPTQNGLQQALDRFLDACSMAGIKSVQNLRSSTRIFLLNLYNE